MSRKFREWQPDATFLFPPSPRDWLPEYHLVYCLLDVTARIDISPIVDDYASDNGGQPPSCIASTGHCSADDARAAAVCLQ
jgi:hypothetical protein